MRDQLGRALHFDRRQAESIVGFLTGQLSDGAVSFRLMPDVFEHSLDLTSYGEDGHELTHIHPPSDTFLRPFKEQAT